jgi:hypothetical protein
MYMFSANTNVLSVSAPGPIPPPPPPPAGNTLNGKLAESTLALAENVYVVLPAPSLLLLLTKLDHCYLDCYYYTTNLLALAH